MIPLQLEICNFLSYRKPTVLDFHGIHLACVSGANGAGKSSILDAVTWALFSQSRSKSDDDVVNRLAVNHGQTAEVKFTFELEGSIYRVIRRKQAGKPMLLEFQVAVSNGKWKALSEGKLRDTQAAIEALLKMNFDTFVNASFLLQNKADEFTTKTPNRRKEILADLLGVNEWDQYREIAAAQRKDTESRLLLLDGRLADIDTELAEQPEREAGLAIARSELESIAGRLATQERLLEQLRRTETAVHQQRHLLKSLADNLSRARRGLEELQQTSARRQAERAAHQALLDQAEAITAGFAAWQAAEATVQEWQQKAEAHNAIQQQKRPHELAIERERSRLAQRVAGLESQERRVAAMGQEREQVSAGLQEGQARQAQLAAQLAELARQEQAWHEARAKLQELEGAGQLLRQEINQLQTQARRVTVLQEEQPVVEKNRREAEAALATTAAQVAAVAEQNTRLMVVMADRDKRQAEQPTLKEEMNKLKERLERLGQETGGACPLCGQTLSESHRQTVLADLELQGKHMGDRYRQNQALIQQLVADIADLEVKVRQKERLEREQLVQQQRLAAAQARLDEIERAINEWQAGDAGRLEALQAQAADDAAIIAQQAAVRELAATVGHKAALEKERQTQERQLSAAEARLAEIDRAVAEWEGAGLASELAASQERLAQDQIVPEAQAALAGLEAQAATLGYDPAAHEAARQARQQLAEAPTRLQQLQQAQAAVRPLEDSLADLDRQVANQENTIADYGRQHDEAQATLEALAADKADLAGVEQEVFQLREEGIAANRRVGAAQQRLAVLDDLRQQREQLTAERAEVTQLIQRLKLLEKACGREGVQALLIERALPDIEDDANELLDRLTGGQMRVVFDTQRRLKTSDRLTETLDIRIVDGAGERPYENYSGGEQFRVNFAIRLALSRVLARRAGARLQTLVIDEGFGSQDPDGRQRLIEAINTIQNDFERILIITHIDELRDAFPTRIEVEKGPGGSVISVI
ncbi:MAG: SMC family ATPase [Chloroflexi bacterium]|nr:SMC family ATPase [Chloroflexota bacterium]MCI0643809.1 SMC family ATPase [Chloroflexota bacterium]MCI0726093.1 SMC family ATPase [Chloroflexota bacterium]